MWSGARSCGRPGDSRSARQAQPSQPDPTSSRIAIHELRRSLGCDKHKMEVLQGIGGGTAADD